MRRPLTLLRAALLWLPHDAIRVIFEHVNYLSTMPRGVIHLRIHSMTGEAAAASKP